MDQHPTLGQLPIVGQGAFSVIVHLRRADRVEDFSFLRPPFLLWLGRRLDMPAVVSFEKNASMASVRRPDVVVAGSDGFGLGLDRV
jgi:hypothetical protein